MRKRWLLPLAGVLIASAVTAWLLSAHRAPTPRPTRAPPPQAEPSPPPALPPARAFPDATTTGVAPGTVLRRVSGTLVVHRHGAGVDNLDIEGSLVIDADSVVVNNVRVRCVNVTDWCVQMNGVNDEVRDSEVGGGRTGHDVTEAVGIWSGSPGSVITGVNVHGTSDGLRVDGDTLVQYNYIHDLNSCCGNHSDGAQTSVGTDIVFRDNTIEGGNNDAIWLKSDDGHIGNVVIDHNHLIGTGTPGSMTSYGLGVEGDVSDVVVVNNVFTGRVQVAAFEAAPGSYSEVSGNALSGIRMDLRRPR